MPARRAAALHPPPQLVIGTSMALAAGAFFLPWVQLLPSRRTTVKTDREWRPKDAPADSKPLLNREMRGYLKELNSGVKSVELTVRNSARLSGYRIPIVANSDTARAAIHLAGLFQRKPKAQADLESAGPKSYAVYLVPGCVLLLGALLLRFGRRPLVAGAVGAVALAVPPVGWWQVRNALSQANGTAAVEYGLWLSLLAYWGLAAGAVLLLAARRRA